MDMIDLDLKGLVFDIQGYSVHDGPGCRTLVFMKGCPLHCEWCSNPEGMRVQQDIMFKNTKCVNRKNGCMRCIDACPSHAIHINPNPDTEAQQLIIDRSFCHRCGGQSCLSVCYFEALDTCGKWHTIGELLHIFERNQHYWGARGGVSFSGGEPLLQHQFMHTLFNACKERQYHVVIETTANIQTEIFLDLLYFVDFAFIDVKHMDSEKHRVKTGVSNDLILHNIEALVKTGWPGRLVLRTPIIENYNDSDENMEAVAAFMKKLGLFEINILPFHRLGDSKWTQLGKQYAFRDGVATPEEKMFHLQDIFLDQRIACYVSSETPF